MYGHTGLRESTSRSMHRKNGVVVCRIAVRTEEFSMTTRAVRQHHSRDIEVTNFVRGCKTRRHKPIDYRDNLLPKRASSSPTTKKHEHTTNDSNGSLSITIRTPPFLSLAELSISFPSWTVLQPSFAFPHSLSIAHPVIDAAFKVSNTFHFKRAIQD